MKRGRKDKHGKSVSVYLPTDIAVEVDAEMLRLNRTRSWLLKRAWLLAREQLQRHPGAKHQRRKP